MEKGLGFIGCHCEMTFDFRPCKRVPVRVYRIKIFCCVNLPFAMTNIAIKNFKNKLRGFKNI